VGLFYKVYYSLLLLGCLLGAYLVVKKDKRFLAITMLLAISLGVEICAHILIRSKKGFVWIYHLYTPVNYGLFAYYFSQYLANRVIKKLVLWSILAFGIISYTLSITLYHFKDFPGVCITINGLFLTVICVYYLLTAEININLSYFKNPNIWIAIGVLVFFGGTAFYNGVYTKMMQLNRERALELFGIINKPLIIFLYSCINIGLICRLVIKKFI